jgi:hypothetical protein
MKMLGLMTRQQEARLRDALAILAGRPRQRSPSGYSIFQT